MGESGFGVPGGWFSDEVRPGGVPAKAGVLEELNGTVYGVGDGLVLAGWTMPGENGRSEGDPMWSVHDKKRPGLTSAGELTPMEP
ncbi:hypothetical protein [Streptomyces ardesiacus]|uniref:hypothetical protein n=1 Tax=Streptomyces ardesiacus TaxID=285564 RepID=UPI003625D1AC